MQKMREEVSEGEGETKSLEPWAKRHWEVWERRRKEGVRKASLVA